MAAGRGLYLRVGVLILAGLALAVGFVLFFTAGRLRDDSVVFETYLRESVQGLEVGAPVRYRGVAIGRVSTTVWAISGALAAIAGIMTGILGSVSTESGWGYILLVLAAAVLGGTGNILGVIAAALVLGIVMDMSALVIDTTYRPIVAFAILIGVLLVRPQGLFSFQSRKEAAA